MMAMLVLLALSSVSAMPLSASPTAAPAYNAFMAEGIQASLMAAAPRPTAQSHVSAKTIAEPRVTAPPSFKGKSKKGSKGSASPRVIVLKLPTASNKYTPAVRPTSSPPSRRLRLRRDVNVTVVPLVEPAPTNGRSTATNISDTTPLASWILPQYVNDANSAFQIDRWVWGSNLATVLPDGIPNERGGNDGMSSVLSVQYPKGSINPSGAIKGGVGFYMAPLDLSQARNVSLAYGIYFPASFDFRKGGKLPGLYGGHGGCSGGNEASTCFSTRLMFRQDGMGELYLYAPVGKQPKSVCNLPPFSTCSAVFGASLGRGSWTFARGGWTHVKQDIWLNTPGQADGGFNIWVNGERVLTANNVFIRNAPPGQTNAPITTREAKAIINADGLLEDLVNDILTDRLNGALAVNQFTAMPVSFNGIMFQTFFGGSQQSYASPKKQQVYFKNVQLDVNS